ncbi:MAG: DUF4132 domain-containing protein [Planctomycetes bacterium]|nr:DUF4132 domain-containing protein [Planctomycetota bacterium]
MTQTAEALIAGFLRAHHLRRSYQDLRRSSEAQAIRTLSAHQRKAILFRSLELIDGVPDDHDACARWLHAEGLVPESASHEATHGSYWAIRIAIPRLAQDLLRTRLDFDEDDLRSLAIAFEKMERGSRLGGSSIVCLSPAGLFAQVVTRYSDVVRDSKSLRDALSAYVAAVHDRRAATRISSVIAGGEDRADFTQKPETLHLMLLGEKDPHTQFEPALWKSLKAGLWIPPEHDAIAPVRFSNHEDVPIDRIELLNRILADAPETPPRRRVTQDLYSRHLSIGAEADAGILLAAAVALSHVDIPWVYENERSQRFHRGHAAIIELSEILFDSIERPSEHFVRTVFMAHSCWVPDSFRPSWCHRAIRLLERVTPSDLVEWRTDTRWSLLRFREHVCRCENAHWLEQLPPIDAQLGIGVDLSFPLGEPWTLSAAKYLRALKTEHAAAWQSILRSSLSAKSATPSNKFLKSSDEAIHAIGQTLAIRQILEWITLFATPRKCLPGGDIEGQDSSIPLPGAASVMRGLVWILGRKADGRSARSLGELALRCYGKVASRGPRCILVGNAAIWALSQIPGPDALGQLAMLRVKVKFIPAQKAIEKALNATAAREGLPRAEIEELGVPTYGLTEVGLRREELGDTVVELTATGGDVSLRFFKKAVAAEDALGARKKNGKQRRRESAADGVAAKGKEIKSVPASVKKNFAEDLKELKAAAKDLASMLSAQRDRIDSMFLDSRSWPLPAWRERYLDHPVVGVIARRVIWTVTSRGTGKSVLYHNGHLVDHRGHPHEPASDGEVRLWHPVEAPQEEVLSWRRFVEENRIRQPFKQAHREVYLLTDAERRTNTYSNRFAAHIVRQHQFHALCGQRNWRNRLRLFVDGEFPPPTKHLPQYGMRAEFWVQEAGEETLDSGAFVYLATDQVRFYRADAAQITSNPQGGGFSMTSATPDQEPIALEQVPPLVLSEVLRDCDLFVGVSSVGNNPAWNDGGPGEFRDYWQTYSFGDLSATAQTRRDLLSRLVPRLKIADRCSLSDRFLIVRGNIRTYKIHLGSGNILMEPNDQYLCIVPSSSGSVGGTKAAGAPGVFLPFEGDRTLSIILSKAFLLAADDAITDTTITRQIAR